jgi:hypothetical protein
MSFKPSTGEQLILLSNGNFRKYVKIAAFITYMKYNYVIKPGK